MAVTFLTNEDDKKYVKSINGNTPDENGNVNVTNQSSGENADYAALSNKPKINGVELTGDKTAEELGIGQPTDEQVNDAVNDYLDANPVECACVFDAVKVRSSQQWFFTGANSSAYGTLGQVIACKTGETFYWDGVFATNGSYTTPRMLSALPNGDSIYDTSVTVGEALTANDDGGYSATTDGAVFFPREFINGSTAENRSWVNIILNAPVDGYYAKTYPDNYVVSSPSPLTLSGIMANFIPLIGKKAAIIGDSLSEQSAGHGNAANDSYGFSQGRYIEEGWFARIARKYNMDYRVHGKGMQWWYCTSDRPNGGVKAVNSLIESGYAPDYIVLEYGTNDIWTGSLGEATDSANAEATSTVGALRYCIETLQAQLPSAKIIVVMPCMRGVNEERQNSYYELIKPILREYGVRCVDMLGNAGIVKSMMNADGVHLATFDTNHYNQHTEAVARYSRCLESEMLLA